MGVNYTTLKKYLTIVNWKINDFYLLKCFFLWQSRYVETDAKKTGLASKLSTNKKSTILTQSSWNFVKLTTSRVGNIGKFLSRLDQNSQILGQSRFLCISLYFLIQLVCFISNAVLQRPVSGPRKFEGVA